MEFSMGTNPSSTSFASTASSTSGTVRYGSRIASAKSGCVNNACSVKVPAGPRKPIRRCLDTHLGYARSARTLRMVSCSLTHMYEYVAFNPYNSSPEALASELTKKSAEGWEVVSIVPTFDGRYCAFLRRASSETSLKQAASSAAQPSSNPKVPAAWYADPSGRYELRYWDGGEWTEHVARGGQQFVDPPTA